MHIEDDKVLILVEFIPLSYEHMPTIVHYGKDSRDGGYYDISYLMSLGENCITGNGAEA